LKITLECQMVKKEAAVPTQNKGARSLSG
jgi:hypothetical protein